MSWLSDAVSSVQNSIPNVGGFAPNVQNLAGLGAPLVGVYKEPTPEEKKQQRQVKDKMQAGEAAQAGDPTADVRYLRGLYDAQMQGFNSDPEAYKGKPTAERAQADINKILTRNTAQTANQNARLGKMGATKGADSLRMAVENSLTNEQNMNNIEAQASADEYASKMDEMQNAYALRRNAGIGAVERQMGRTDAVNSGWQGELGRLGKSIVEGGGVGGAVTYGANKLNQGLGQNNEYFRNTFGNTAVDAGNLLLDPNESVRQIQGQWTRQAGKKNPFLIEGSQMGLDPFRGK